MTASRKIANSIVAHGLGVTGCELPAVSKGMQELHEIQVERLKAALDEANMLLALTRGLSRDKDRERRRTISSLMMGLFGMALLAAYLGFRR